MTEGRAEHEHEPPSRKLLRRITCGACGETRDALYVLAEMPPTDARVAAMREAEDQATYDRMIACLHRHGVTGEDANVIDTLIRAFDQEAPVARAARDLLRTIESNGVPIRWQKYIEAVGNVAAAMLHAARPGALPLPPAAPEGDVPPVFPMRRRPPAAPEER